MWRKECACTSVSFLAPIVFLHNFWKLAHNPFLALSVILCNRLLYAHKYTSTWYVLLDFTCDSRAPIQRQNCLSFYGYSLVFQVFFLVHHLKTSTSVKSSTTLPHFSAQYSNNCIEPVVVQPNQCNKQANLVQYEQHRHCFYWVRHKDTNAQSKLCQIWNEPTLSCP